MANEAGAIELPLGVFVILRDLIRDRLGIWFEDDKRHLLASKLSDRLHVRGFRTFLDYYYLLKYDASRDQEWEELTDALSVQETYFWREAEQFRILTDILLPQVPVAAGQPIRIWCAACASGEEPLSIAIALQETGWFDKANIEILASDASQAALRKATRGVYRERAFRSLSIKLRNKYFSEVEGGWRVHPEIHSRVRFHQANLLEAREVAPLAAARFIFCRNVFIYFSTATISRVVAQFADSMARPGYLFVGVSESLLRVSSSFQLEEIDGAFVYVQR
jgi:chemotaxis protein methyltransferase CheR